LTGIVVDTLRPEPLNSTPEIEQVLVRISRVDTPETEDDVLAALLGDYEAD
jgi:hypothetical protein